MTTDRESQKAQKLYLIIRTYCQFSKHCLILLRSVPLCLL